MPATPYEPIGGRRGHSLTAAAVLLLAAGGLAQQWNFLDGPAYGGRMAAFDWTRGRLVSFGQEGATWEFDDVQLLSRAVYGTSPAPRWRGTMVYDLAHRHVLLFGGIDASNTALDDTWTWDGANWTRLSSGPPARGDAAGVYDILRSRVVVYGGFQPFGSVMTDTWEHDGTQWLQMHPNTVPGPNSPVMAYDLQRGVAVMVVHAGSVNTPVSTYTWDGVDWTLRSTLGPTSNGNESMAYDLNRAVTVLCGGVGTGNAIWEWDGATWRQIAVPGVPARLDPAVHYDPLHGCIGIVGGWDFRLQGFTVLQGSARTDSWLWDGTSLVAVHGDLRPQSRYGHAWVADDAHGELLLFGGLVQQAPIDDTWTFDGNVWTQQHPTAQPSPRLDAAAAFDSTFGRVLLFGGNAAPTGQRNDLWAWNGTTWSPVDSGTGPSPRAGAGLAFDAARGVAVLFGGYVGALYLPASLRNDTWEWNGFAWSRPSTAAAPSPREGAAMAYDPGRGATVLFGGRNGATAQNQFADTWQWNGSQWQAIVTPTTPPALLQPSLNFDAASNGVLLSGTQITGSTFDKQVWRLANGAWTLLASSTNTQLGGPTVMDPLRQRLVSNKGVVIAELTSTAAAVSSIGSACGTPLPMLQTRARPRLGAAGFGLEMRTETLLPVLFALSTAPANLPLGNGCTLWIGAPALTAFVPSNFAGQAELTLPIPFIPSLRGVGLYAQAATPSPAGTGMRLSQGLRLQLGD